MRCAVLAVSGSPFLRPLSPGRKSDGARECVRATFVDDVWPRTAHSMHPASLQGTTLARMVIIKKFVRTGY